MTIAEWIATILKIAVMVNFLLAVGGVLTWLDRRQSAMIHDRIGPNRAMIKLFGTEWRLAGLLHTVADGIKFFFKEDFIPPKADRLLFGLAPILVMVAVLGLVGVIPFGDTISVSSLWQMGADGHLFFPSVPRYGVHPEHGGWVIPLQISTLNIGVLYMFALAGQGIVGAAIAGWSSDNKFSLLGALRAASQMISYEVVLGMSLVGTMMIYGTTRLEDMVRWQGENTWGIFIQPVSFFIFFVASVAESKRIPFDLPEAESELVSGYFTEYSGMKFGMFYFAEYMEIVTSSMLLVAIFLGGWQLPFLHPDGVTISFGNSVWFHRELPHLCVIVLGVVAFFVKVLAVCWMQAFIRWSLPRFRYDQLMKLCWKRLLPISLANIFVTGVLYFLVQAGGDACASFLKLVADWSQAAIVLGVWIAFVEAFIGFFKPKKKSEWNPMGSSARQVAALGGLLNR
ncbi:NADH-quinone oxidoreductase subunit NuoH [Pajaroellobacter abortibovis]|uniref:NADH-quinone oxidoreductase subunit H n=1 Tax=Pajaroellobacter abortibovis TaxID=1882918 RepID=A0A1L6MXL2_9BACT|nr:NADH-quinone oxidoreductase subunit NuoH [Pajaroellobacter abortibovis]APS00138.1 hypothetical protein BCY86_05180 [Pajaroellobacter abortibovis]